MDIWVFSRSSTTICSWKLFNGRNKHIIRNERTKNGSSWQTIKDSMVPRYIELLHLCFRTKTLVLTQRRTFTKQTGSSEINTYIYVCLHVFIVDSISRNTEDRYLLHALFNGPDIGVCPRFTKKLILCTDRMLPRQAYLMLTLYTAKLWQFGLISAKTFIYY